MILRGWYRGQYSKLLNTSCGKGSLPHILWTSIVLLVSEEVFHMRLKEAWRGLTIMLLIGIVAGIINVLFFILVMNPLTVNGKSDEVAVNTYVINFFVGWVFFSAWFLARADDELKNVETAIHKRDKETFMIEAPKQIAVSIRILYLVISMLVIFSFHLFHMENLLITSEIQFGVGFLVVTTALVLWDLDDPIGGAICAPGIPDEWLQELHEKKKNRRNLPKHVKTTEAINAEKNA